MTEDARQVLTEAINHDTKTREELMQLYGADWVWDTDQALAVFDFIGFLAPFVKVQRKSDGREMVLMFQHHPRFYWHTDQSNHVRR